MSYIEKRINRLLADAAVLEVKLGGVEYKHAMWLSDNPGEDACFEI